MPGRGVGHALLVVDLETRGGARGILEWRARCMARRLRAGGSGGDRHVSMGQLPAWSVQDDVRTSLDRCAQWTGARPFAFSYPYGRCEAATPQAAAAAAAGGA